MTKPHPVLVALIAASALFMQMLDATIIATALPQMAVTFGTSPIRVSIGITAYILTAAAVIPISGWLADRFGSRNVLIGAVALFTLGSVFCGMSPTLPIFTASRILQGVAAAVMTPVAQLVVVRDAEKHELVRSITLMTVPGLVAPVIGPPLGGFITTYVSWHWIFFLNVPLGLLGSVLIATFIRNHRSEARRPLDWTGFAMTGAALCLAMYALDLAGHRGASWSLILVLLVLGIAFAIAAISHARRVAHPVLDLSPLSIPTYALATGFGAIFRTTAGATPFLMPLMLQIGFGMTAFSAGLTLLVHAGADLAMKLRVRSILKRFGFRGVLICNGLIVAGFMGLYALLVPTGPRAFLLIVFAITGASRSLQFTGLNTLAYADIAPEQMSVATTLTAMIQQVAIGVGVAGAAILLQASLALRGAVGDTPALADFHAAFLVVAAFAAVSALGFLKLEHAAGTEVSGHGVAKAA